MDEDLCEEHGAQGWFRALSHLSSDHELDPFLPRTLDPRGGSGAHDLLRRPWLRSNLEYHILANHLLENLLACCLAAVYFDRADWKRGVDDAGRMERTIPFRWMHYEQSPMYHMILTDRMLDLCLLLSAQGEMEHLSSCQKVLQPALNFAVFVHPYGHLPSFNDCATEVASSLEVIEDKASLLGLSALPPKQAGSSGFRKWVIRTDGSDGPGACCPTYQSGHAHADTFGFELFDKQLGPLIVHMERAPINPMSGDSTRSTAAHNTVSYVGADSSGLGRLSNGWSGRGRMDHG